MDFDQLLAFDRIVREGGFSRAARGLGISQPSVTARIQTLRPRSAGRSLCAVVASPC
jgi:DNA-binding transcriptional LysR family regulator